MNSLWREKFDFKPMEPFAPTMSEFQQAADWVFERDKEGNFCRVKLALWLIRSHSWDLKRRGVKDYVRIAHIGVFRRCAGQVKVPTRKQPTSRS